ncbi:MAG: hypothetical protein II336_15335 [Loktanella sp.]|nr:hypothetical protein [Loktanella sp.]
MPGVKGRSGGGNKKSIEQHQLEGSYRADRHANVLVPEKNRVRVEPQQHLLEINPVINRKEIFEYFADVLHEQGMTQEVDSILLSQLVEAQAMYVTALAYYKSDPEAMIGKKLAFNLALEASREVRIIMGEFRLLPSSRTVNLDKTKQVEADPVADFLNMKTVSK